MAIQRFRVSPPLSQRGGVRGGVWRQCAKRKAQCTMHDDCLAASPPLSQRGGVRGGVWRQSAMPGSLPSPFPKGRGQGWGLEAKRKAQSTMTAWQLPLPFPKGEGSGVGFGCKAQCAKHDGCLAASPFPNGRGLCSQTELPRRLNWRTLSRAEILQNLSQNLT